MRSRPSPLPWPRCCRRKRPLSRLPRPVLRPPCVERSTSKAISFRSPNDPGLDLRSSGRPKAKCACGVSGSAILEPDLDRGLDSDHLSLVDLDEDGAVLDGAQRISHRADRRLFSSSSTVARVSRLWVTHRLAHSPRSVIGVSSTRGYAIPPAGRLPRVLRPGRTIAAVLQVNGVSVEVAGRVVVRDVTFSLRADEVAGLVGRNGAGKTSLLRVLAGEAPAVTRHVVRA